MPIEKINYINNQLIASKEHAYSEVTNKLAKHENNKM